MFSLKNSAFTLVELMVTIVIIGVLAAVAIASYGAYANKARQAEAQTAVEKMSKDQTAYYLANKTFHWVSLNPSPSNLYNGTNTGSKLHSRQNGMQYSSGFEVVGYPFAAGSNVNFVYQVYSGKTDANGDDITNFCTGAACNFRPMSANISAHGWRVPVGTTGHVACSDESRYLYSSYKTIAGRPHYNWAILIGSRDFDRDSAACTVVFKILDTDTRGNVDMSFPIRILTPGE